MARLFLLNFDAEYELEGGARYVASQAMRTRLLELEKNFRSSIATDDLMWSYAIENSAPRLDHEHEIRLWCATEQAQAAARNLLAAETLPLPAGDIVRAVNHRRFAWELCQHLSPNEMPNALWVDELSPLQSIVGCLEQQRGQTWVAKRAFAVAGRGQRKLRDGLSPEDLAWIDASRANGFVLEPLREIDKEFSTHGWIAEDGRVILGRMSVCEGTHGAFASSRIAVSTDLSFHQRQKLGEVAHQVGSALFARGYFGPYGVDAYLASGRSRLRTLSEINARFCMGWDPELDGWDPP